MLELGDYLILMLLMLVSNIIVIALSILYIKGKIIYMLNDILPKLGKSITKAVFRQMRSLMGNAAKKKQAAGGGSLDLGSFIGPLIQEVGPQLVAGFLKGKQPPV